MKKKILSLVVVFAMIFAYMPVLAYAGDSSSSEPLLVSFDKELNYVSLGDSVAAGYGLGAYAEDYAVYDNSVFISNVKQIWDIPYSLSGGFDYSPEESYPSLVEKAVKEQDRTGKTTVNHAKRAVCIARIQDVCTFIDSTKYKPDDFFNGLVVWMLRGTLDSATSGVKAPSIEKYWELADYSLVYPEGVNGFPSLKAINADYSEKVKNADFITISAGGNNFYSYVLFTGRQNWYIDKEGNCSTTYTDGASRAFQWNLSDWYDDRTVRTIKALRTTAVAEAKLVDLAKKYKKNGETAGETDESLAQLKEVIEFFGADLSTTESSVKSAFNLIERLAYTIGAYKQSVPELLDLIHKKNPDAKIALTAIPVPYCDYSIKISDNLTISLAAIFKPIFGLANRALKKAAEERSDYVRYIDVPNPDLLTPLTSSTGEIGGSLVPALPSNTLTIEGAIALLLGPLEATHPSAEGHQQIATEIMKNFTFENTASDGPASIGDILKSLWKKIFNGNASAIVKIFDRLKHFNIFRLIL